MFKNTAFKLNFTQGTRNSDLGLNLRFFAVLHVTILPITHAIFKPPSTAPYRDRYTRTVPSSTSTSKSIGYLNNMYLYTSTN